MEGGADKYLVEDLVKDILETFDVSPRVAEERAIGVLRHMDAHCSVPSRSDAFGHILRLYGSELPWRSKTQREAWLSDSQASIAGYNSYLDARRASPFKKW